jgi:hypothetical protein
VHDQHRTKTGIPDVEGQLDKEICQWMKAGQRLPVTESVSQRNGSDLLGMVLGTKVAD